MRQCIDRPFVQRTPVWEESIISHDFGHLILFGLVFNAVCVAGNGNEPSAIKNETVRFIV